MKTFKFNSESNWDYIPLCNDLFGPAGTQPGRRWFYRTSYHYLTARLNFPDDYISIRNTITYKIASLTLYFRKDSDLTLFLLKK